MSSRQVKITEAEQLNPGQMLGIMVEGKNILLATIESVLSAISKEDDGF